MTVAVPPPVPLDLPPGDPAALADLVRGVAGGAHWLAGLGERLAGPAATAPGWLGADATAAAVQIATVAALARDAGAALLTASGRLSRHHDLLVEVRHRVRLLRAEQDEDFAATWRLLHHLDDAVRLMLTDAAPVVAIVADLEAAEAARRREHGRLLDELAGDAAATARVLADASAVAGGTGRHGDASRAVARLAAALPGWGDAELGARGRALADTWGGDLEVGEWEALARRALPYAGSAAFADAFLAGLGPGGLRQMLIWLGHGVFGDDMLGESSAVARLVASALGGARATGSARDPVGEVLSAGYAAVSDATDESDLVALGMAAVLAAAPHRGGPRASTVAHWGRQILAREAAFGGEHAERRAYPAVEVAVDLSRFDAVPLIVGYLVEHGTAADAAALLGSRTSWDALLARTWADCGSGLAALVGLAGAEPGAAGDIAVRNGLAALGAGLADGDPDGWTVEAAAASAVRPALGNALAGHVQVAVDALWVGVDGSFGPAGGDVVRGLGCLTLDRGAAAAVESALAGWARVQPVPAGPLSDAAVLPAAAVPGAFVAVQEYGQRLAYALHGFERQEEAETRALWWDLTVGLAATFLTGWWGPVGAVAEGYAARWLGFDGTWDNGPDRGLVLDRGNASSAAIDALPPGAAAVVEQVGRHAQAGYGRTIDALGVPRPPQSPVIHWWEPLVLGPLPDAVDLPSLVRAVRRELREVESGVD